MVGTKQERFPDYPIFKGLQRPLEFFGLQGRLSACRPFVPDRTSQAVGQ